MEAYPFEDGTHFIAGVRHIRWIGVDNGVLVHEGIKVVGEGVSSHVEGRIVVVVTAEGGWGG